MINIVKSDIEDKFSVNRPIQ